MPDTVKAINIMYYVATREFMQKWKENLKQLDEADLKEGVKRKLLRDNAVELFKLGEGGA